MDFQLWFNLLQIGINILVFYRIGGLIKEVRSKKP